jgi:hypothetical protein
MIAAAELLLEKFGCGADCAVSMLETILFFLAGIGTSTCYKILVRYWYAVSFGTNYMSLFMFLSVY